MSRQSRDLSQAELRAAETAVRNQLTDPAAFGTLMGGSRDLAEQLLSPKIHTRAMDLVVMLCLVSKLRGKPISPTDRPEIDEALLTVRLIQRSQLAEPALDLSLTEIRAVTAAMRGEQPDVQALAAFINESTTTCYTMLFGLRNSRALDAVLVTCLLLRLHGLRVKPRVLLASIHAICDYGMQNMLRSAAH